MKICNNCLELKSLELYSNNRRFKDGKQRICKSCYKQRGYKSISSMHKARFGGLRDLVLKRDNFKCVGCNMTDIEHIEKWGRHLTLDHIDGKGRHYIEKGLNPNNTLNNLQTLCLRCHGSVEARRYWQARS